MIFSRKTELTGPWYRHRRYWEEYAKRLLKELRKRQLASNLSEATEEDRLFQAQVTSFSKHTWYQMVFESNLIEGSGLSKGETKEIANAFPQMPEGDFFLDFEGYISNLKTSIEEMTESIAHLNLTSCNVIPSFKYKRKSKAAREVTQHFSALAYLEKIRNAYFFRLLSRALTLEAEIEHKRCVLDGKRTSFKRKWQKVLNELPKGLVAFRLEPCFETPSCLDAEAVSSLHRILMNGLIEKSAKVKAGNFRIHDIRTDNETIYCSPDLIPRSMDEFYQLNRELAKQFAAEEISVFEFAAEISYKFVRIHPFPDGNGRTSRLLMNFILSLSNVPFMVVLRGIGKEKGRYFKSLRRAGRVNGSLDGLIAMICKQFVNAIWDIDDRLTDAGLQSIESSIAVNFQ